MATNSPNMNLVLPTIGVDSGLVWEQSVNANSLTLDQHNHSSGFGVQITPSGLNISQDLPINNNNLTLIRSTRFLPQGTTLSGASDLGCLYVSGVDLYFNDGSGNKIQVTSGGSVNATSSGISSGTASASFISSALVVNQASNTPANIQAGSILIGNNTSGSKFTTLSAAPSLASNFTITLPSGLPGSQSILTMDSSGNLGGYWNVDNLSLVQVSGYLKVAPLGITSNLIANGTITMTQISGSAGIVGTQLANGTITSTQIASGTVTGSNIAANTVAASNLVALNYSSNSNTNASVASGAGFASAAAVSQATTGRPVAIVIEPITSSSNPMQIYVSDLAGAPLNGVVQMKLLLDGSVAKLWQFQIPLTGSGLNIAVPIPAMSVITGISAATHSFNFQIQLTGAAGCTLFMPYFQLSVYGL